MGGIGRSRDITGKVFGKLTVLGLAGREVAGTRWTVRCECGTVKNMWRSVLLRYRRGPVSCGCRYLDEISSRAQERARRVMDDGRKACSRCGATKALDGFYRRSNTQDTYSAACKECVLDANARRVYGIGLAEKQALVDGQGGVCAVPGCERVIDAKSGTIDHCHKSGQVREVLCGQCNSAFGLLGEDVGRILGLAKYAQKWKPPSRADQ